MEGYRAGLKSAGLPLDDEIVERCSPDISKEHESASDSPHCTLIYFKSAAGKWRYC